MFKNRSVDVHDFSMVPRADIPRSSFRMQHVHKTCFDGGYLVPMYVDEMLPGDTFNMRCTGFVRLATPLFPTLDNLHVETFWFACPMRLVWDNFVRMMGERDPNPDSSISYVVPQVVPVGGWAVGSVQDYMGLPTVGQITPGESWTHSCLPLRAYNLIWNQWFRDENLQNSVDVSLDDGPDGANECVLLKRGKRHDYFTACLPNPQKGTAVSLPLGTSAPVLPVGGLGASGPTFNVASTQTPLGGIVTVNGSAVMNFSLPADAASFAVWNNPNLYADLSSATAATINSLRQAFQIQRLLERDMRGGTRYIETIRAHFGVISPDARLQRPEYLGGSSSMVVINPVAQTSGTNVTGSDTPQGNLAAVGTGLIQTGFTYSATEHTIIIGLVNVRADLTYQQGLRRMWSRSTRYDFYWPVFAHLGEQAVLRKEIYMTGAAANDDVVFGYQERWAEYRYFPSQVTSLMRSTAANTIDPWHYAQEFGSAPTLNSTFIQDATDSVLARATAVGTAANGQQLLADFFFDNRAARPMPMYSVPGLVDHF